jgi:hypothetical protein
MGCAGTATADYDQLPLVPPDIGRAELPAVSPNRVVLLSNSDHSYAETDVTQYYYSDITE